MESKRKTQRRISNCVALKNIYCKTKSHKTAQRLSRPKTGTKNGHFRGRLSKRGKNAAKLSFCRVFYVYGYAPFPSYPSLVFCKYGFKHKVFVVVMIDGLYRHSHRLAMYVYIVRRFRAMPQFTPSALSVF